jgi:hypothetical protein
MRASDGECCPYCGGTEGVTTNDKAIGWIERHVFWNGVIDYTSLDKLRETKAASGVCIDCGKRVRAPENQS